MSANAAAALISDGDRVGMSGFTGAGDPKKVPVALAKRILDHKLAGNDFRIDVKPLLRDYVRRAAELAPGKHTPHLLGEAFSFHERYLRTRTMHA